jgi:hypothetical protein
MKTFKSLIESLAEAWPGTPEYKKKFGSPSADGPDGSRHKIDRTPGITRATRKYDAESGESEEPTKSREDAAAAPAKRGRGRPPGKYGSYKKKVKESLEILESLETEEEISEFVDSLDEESFAELQAYLSEDTEQIDEISLKTATKAYKKMAAGGNDMKNRTGLAGDQSDRLLGKMKKKWGEKEVNKAVRENEEIDEALKGDMHPDAGKVLKHIKPEHHSTYTPYLKKGVYKGNYSDRAAVLSAAEKAGHVKEEYVQEETSVDEKYMGFDKLTSELKSKGAKDPKALAAWIGRKKHGKAAFQKAAAAGEKMRESEEEVDEALKHPNHKVLDKNRNNRLDKEDFAILRGEKKAPVKETSVESVAAFLSKQAKGEA